MNERAGGGRSTIAGDEPSQRLESSLSSLRPPRLRADTVTRTALLDRLPDDPSVRCVLIQAPAGYGKTTFAVQWLARDPGRPVAWLTVDEYHDDPVHFWSAVIAAIQRVQPDFGRSNLAVLRQAGARIHPVALPRLVNEIIDIEAPITLVLDDLHQISNSDVAQSLSWLVAQMPGNLRVVVITREAPSVPFGRLRAAGQLQEVGPEMLRFTEAEAGRLLGSLCPELDDQLIAKATRKTEGWPVGLVLVGMAMRADIDPAELLQDFDGWDRDIEEYLVEEVVEKLPVEDQDWLRVTSILAELTPHACDAAAATTDSAARLARLSASNAFVVALDRRGGAYRYHRLFADCLQKQLKVRQPDELRAAHLRASAWYRQVGNADVAFGHALASGDADYAAEVATDSAYDLMSLGRTATLRAQLRALGDEVLARHPELALAGAISAGVEGAEQAPLEVPRLLAIARESATTSSADEETLRWRIEIVGSVFSFVGVERAREVSLEILARSGDIATLPMVWICAAMASYFSGRLGDAAHYAEAAEEQVALGANAVPSLEHVIASALLALVATDRNDYETARQLADRAMSVLADNELTETPTAALAPIALGRLLLRTGALDEAETLLLRGVDLAPGWSLPRIQGLLDLAELALRRRDRNRARALLEAAGQAIEDHQDPGALRLIHRRLAAQSRRHRAGDSEAEAPQLTRREREILDLLPTALTTRQMAERLYISHNTVKTHLRSLYRKLGVGNRSDAVAHARRSPSD